MTLHKNISSFFELFLRKILLMDEEQNIIKSIANGDEEALRILYEDTSKNVFYYLFRLVNNKEMAEDLMIETYTQVWLSAKKFRGDSGVLTWILGIARNLTMNEIKKKDYSHRDLTSNEFMLAEQLKTICQKELTYIMSEALKRLSFKHQEVLDLIFIHELTYEEIAKILNIPINTVKTRIFYAKKQLREILKNMGITKDELF